MWHASPKNVTHDAGVSRPAAYNGAMQRDTLSMEVVAGTAKGTTVVRLTGSITLSTCFDLQDFLRADKSDWLILDMQAIKYVDSSGIGCLVNGYVSHQMTGGKLVLAGTGTRILETLSETRVAKFFTICGSVEEAELEASASAVR